MFISPKDILCDFLRCHLVDSRGRAESLNSEVFDGAGRDYTLSPPQGSVSCIISVYVNGTLMNKWRDYYFDFQNQVLVFSTPYSTGNTITVAYKYGVSNWIYPDKAKDSLKATSFPRISIMKVSGSGQRIGQYNAVVEKVNRFQIDIWVKEDYTTTIDGVIYAEEKLAEYIAYQIQTAFENYESELFSQFYNYTLLSGPNDLGFDETYLCFHEQIDVELKSIDEGKL